MIAMAISRVLALDEGVVGIRTFSLGELAMAPLAAGSKGSDGSPKHTLQIPVSVRIR